MVCTQLSRKNYERFTRQLIKNARQEPMDESFSFTVTMNQAEYILKIQPDHKNKIYALQALKVERVKDEGIYHMLISDNCFLLSLLNLLIRQGF